MCPVDTTSQPLREAAAQAMSGRRSGAPIQQLVRVAIPLWGKMAFRSFHNRAFIDTVRGGGLEPVYFIERKYAQGLNPSRYGELQVEPYRRLYERPWLKLSAELRRFLVPTETTELRFRDSLWHYVIFSERPLWLTMSVMMAADALRRMRPLAPALLALERAAARPRHHVGELKQRQIERVLTPGVGSYGFLYEGLFAREAQRLGVKVISAVTNYDNIVNRGYRGFLPDRMAVWSRLMADEAMRHLDIPAKRIMITGAAQFDRYCTPLPVSRETYLSSRGLDPDKKTIFFAGSGMVTQLYDFLKVIRRRWMANGTLKDYNIVVRPPPNDRVLSWYGIEALTQLLAEIPGAYVSDPRLCSSDHFMPVPDADVDAELDELHCLFTYSDVLINTYSTVSLEAAMNDLPTIHLGYEDFSFGLRYPSFVAYNERMTHNRRPARLAAARIARSEEELVRYVEMYARDRSIDRDKRYEYARLECGELDGKSTERLTAVVAA